MNLQRRLERVDWGPMSQDRAQGVEVRQAALSAYPLWRRVQRRLNRLYQSVLQGRETELARAPERAVMARIRIPKQQWRLPAADCGLSHWRLKSDCSRPHPCIEDGRSCSKFRCPESCFSAV
jgi:hypothetical protein